MTFAVRVSVTCAVAAASTLLLATAAVASPPLAKAAYERHVQRVGQLYVREKAMVIQHAGSSDMSRWALQGQQLATLYRHLATRLAALVPPKEVASDQRAMVAAFRAVAAHAAAWHDAALRGDGAAANHDGILMYLDPVVQRGLDARADMLAKGYHLGVFAGG